MRPSQREDNYNPMEFIQMLAGLRQAMPRTTPNPMDLIGLDQRATELDLRKQSEERLNQQQQWAMGDNNPENALMRERLLQMQQLFPLNKESLESQNTAQRLENASNLGGSTLGGRVFPQDQNVQGFNEIQRRRLADEMFRMIGLQGAAPSEIYNQSEAFARQTAEQLKGQR